MIIAQRILLLQLTGFTLPVLSYWLMAANNILTTQRLDPLLFPGIVASHVHSVLGGSNFTINSSSNAVLRKSECTSIPIQEDKSNYWYPHLYFQRNDGSFIAVDGSAVMYVYYLFSDNSSVTTPFPDDFRMISGNTALRTLDPSNVAQQAVTFLCLNFEGESPKTNELPVNQGCPAGIRTQINFPSCWDGVNTDSSDYKSHVAFPSTGPDNGTCDDPDYPVTIPRIFLEVYWITSIFDEMRENAMTPSQPFVFSNGDPTGYGFHADFVNGWDAGVLEKAIDRCNCDPFGDPSCCVSAGAFTMDHDKQCFISDTVDEQVFGTLATLPGANPVQAPCYESYIANYTPAVLNPVFVSSTAPNRTGDVLIPASTTNVTQTAQGTCIRIGRGERLELNVSTLLLVGLAVAHHIWTAI